jgi:hypothetical protein
MLPAGARTHPRTASPAPFFVLVRSRLKSAARAVRAARFLRAVHPPCSGWNDGDARDHIFGPFLGGLVRAHAGVAGEHLALHLQRNVAGADHRAVRQQPVDRHIVDQKLACDMGNSLSWVRPVLRRAILKAGRLHPAQAGIFKSSSVWHYAALVIRCTDLMRMTVEITAFSKR